MEKLIPIVMKLQDAFNAINVRNQIELPQIVVVGSQSTGKSSVLESIVGRDFLPRGSGIVTRCPLVLQLKRIEVKEQIQSSLSQNQSSVAEYGEFLHKRGEKFYDFNKIRKEIEEQTNRIAGADKNISEEPISLTIYSPFVVDLTMVDLPGITKVPIKGQPHDIEEQIKRITYKYIGQPNALILALTAANTDLANSDALKMAREVDPMGERTIGVVTKIDLMDQGTDALDLLQGKIYPLKLGYYGVKCRSQKQIDQQISIKEALEYEKEFFSNHPVYSSHFEKLGVPYLAENMNRILCAHIVKCIPQLSRQINELLQQKEYDLVQLNMSSLSIDGDKGPVVLNLINKFTSHYGDMIEGKFVKESAIECLGGSRINFIFHEIFVKSVKEIDPLSHLKDTDIQTAIKNAQALSPGLFVPEVAFEVLVRQQIARLLEPSIECAQKVYKELREIINKIDLAEINRFQRLKYKIQDVMEKVLDKCMTPTTDMIIQIIEIENAHINTNHPDFIGGADSLLNLFAPQAEAEENEEPYQEKQKQTSLLEKKQAANKEVKEEAKVSQSQMIKSSVQQSKPSKKGQEEEKAPQQQQQQQQPGSSGVLSYFFGGSSNNQNNQKNDMLNNSSLAKSEIAEEQIDTFDKKLYQKSQREHDFEILQRFGQDPKAYDRSNLPPINLPSIPNKMRAINPDGNSRAMMETMIIENLIQSYFSIVKKNVADMIPKIIMAFLVNESKNIAQGELVTEIYRQSDLDQIMIEDPIISQTRQQRKKEIQALRTAQLILSEVQQQVI